MAQIMVIQARSASEWVCGDASGPTRWRFVLIDVSENASQRPRPWLRCGRTTPGLVACGPQALFSAGLAVARPGNRRPAAGQALLLHGLLLK